MNGAYCHILDRPGVKTESVYVPCSAPVDIQSFSRDIILLLMEYVKYEDQVVFISSCQEWYRLYMKKYIRRLIISSERAKNWNLRIGRLLEDPFHQLNINRTFFALESDFFSIVNYSCCELILTANQFFTLMKMTVKLRAKILTIVQIDGTSTNVPSYQQIHHGVSMLADCQTLSLQFQFHKGSEMIPTIPRTTKSLTIANGADVMLSLVPMIGQLQHLTLSSCAISDVSLLGAIPHLELEYCDNIVDISALNDNHHIIIYSCSSIQDYSRSFSNSTKIEVTTFIRNVLIDLTRWRKVTHLKLLGEDMCFVSSNRLPLTVKRCHLLGDCVRSVDFRVTAAHALQELTLSSYYRKMNSLEGYGLERVGVINLYSLDKLQSIQGLGGREGKTRKVLVNHCNAIKDFSPLQDIPIVEIINCSGFTDPLQLRFVRDLRISIASKRYINFPASVEGINHPFANIQSLTLMNIHHVKAKEGLAKIPLLQLSIGKLRHLQTFLQGGSPLENQRVVILDPGSCSNPHYITKLIGFHHQFMNDRYDFFCKFGKKYSKKWVWVKK